MSATTATVGNGDQPGERYGFVRVNVEPDPDAVRTETLKGDPHLVAPVVAVAEGILNGGFLPFEEIAASAPGWNGQPVTATHPVDEDGNFIPANSADELELFEIGRFLNVEAADKRLAGELWINLVDVKRLVEADAPTAGEARNTVEKLRAGEPLEVSTGYWHGVVPQAGEFNGMEFEQVQVDLLPDHLATLPNAEGACDWDGTSTAVGCGAPRTQGLGAFSANAAVDVDVFLHGQEYDPDAIDAANLLDTARTPEFEGTTSDSWSAPSLEDFDVDADSVGELSGEERTDLAQTSLLGDADAETFEELVFFPVVEPGSRDLNENALDAVLSGRGAQADISEQQLMSARGVARTLLEDEFDRDLEDNLLRSLAKRVGLGHLLGGDDVADASTTDVSYGLHGPNCGCSHPTMGESTDTDDGLESLADDIGLDVETLREMDEEAVQKLRDAQNDDPGGDDPGDPDDPAGQAGADPDPDGTGNDDDLPTDVQERLDALQETVEDLESQVETKADRLVDAITGTTNFEAEELPDDVEKLEAFAEKLGVNVDEYGRPTTSPTGSFAGRAAGTEDADEFEVEIDGYFASQEEAETAEAED